VVIGSDFILLLRVLPCISPVDHVAIGDRLCQKARADDVIERSSIEALTTKFRYIDNAFPNKNVQRLRASSVFFLVDARSAN
jgi:hypothetical protein